MSRLFIPAVHNGLLARRHDVAAGCLIRRKPQRILVGVLHPVATLLVHGS